MRLWFLLASVLAFVPGCAVRTGAYVGPVEPVGYYGYAPAPVYVARPVYVGRRVYVGPRGYGRRVAYRRHARW